MSDVNKQLLDALANEVKDAVIAEVTKDNIISVTGAVIKRAKHIDLSAIVDRYAAAAEQAQSSNCITKGRREQMLELANEITSSASPDEDELLEVAYSIARYLKLDWPSAYDVDCAFKRIDEALTGMAITVEEEQTFKHLRAMLSTAPTP